MVGGQEKERVREEEGRNGTGEEEVKFTEEGVMDGEEEEDEDEEG